MLLLANFGIFILEAFVVHFSGVAGYNQLLTRFGLVPAGVIPGLRIWKPFTYLFLHDVNSFFFTSS